MNELSISTGLSNIAPILSASEIITNTEATRYNFHDYVAPFQPETIEILKSPAQNGIKAYRSFITWYPCDADHTPLRLRNRPGRKIKDPFTFDEVAAMNSEKKIKELMHLALSCNSSEEAALQSLEKKLEDLKAKGLSKEEIDTIMEERGLYVAPILIKPEHGLITDFVNDHNNILLFEGVSFTEMVIPDCKPIKFEYKL